MKFSVPTGFRLKFVIIAILQKSTDFHSTLLLTSTARSESVKKCYQAFFEFFFCKSAQIPKLQKNINVTGLSEKRSFSRL